MSRTDQRMLGVFLAACVAGGSSGGCTGARENASQPVGTAEEAGATLEAGRVADAGVAASQAMSHVTRARDALEKEQVAHAQALLEASLADMDHIFTWLPEEPLYGAVDSAAMRLEREGAEGADLGPLEERLLARKDSLPPGVLADVRAARELLGEGKPSEALHRLRQVRQVLGQELFILPVEEARARVRQAASALEAGQPEQALSWLENVPELLDEVRTFSPLVPARWEVRAAAAAAARGEWERAEALLRTAVERLERYRGTLESPRTLRVERLEADARLLLRRMDGWSPPPPSHLLWLAERMGPGSPVGGSGVP